MRSRSFPAPAVCPVVRFSSEVTLAPLFQMRSLETISMARRNGRGPDISLTSPWTFVCTRRSLTDSHSLCTQKSSFTCHGGQLCGQRNTVLFFKKRSFGFPRVILSSDLLHYTLVFTTSFLPFAALYRSLSRTIRLLSVRLSVQRDEHHKAAFTKPKNVDLLNITMCCYRMVQMSSLGVECG